MVNPGGVVYSFHLSNSMCLFKYSVAIASSTGLHASQIRNSVPIQNSLKILYSANYETEYGLL